MTTAAILAGGLGTRLREVVNDRPKVLAEVKGRPFLSHLLERLQAAGIKHVVLCTGFMGDQVREAYGNSFADVRLAYSQEATPLGTAGALRLALPMIESEAALVLNGDSFCGADLAAFWSHHESLNAEGSLVLIHSDDTARFGRVEVDDSGRIKSFNEKSVSAGSGWINAGIYALSRELIESIPSDRSCSLEREMFPVWIERGLNGYKCVTEFLDIGTPESYARASTDFNASTDSADYTDDRQETVQLLSEQQSH